MYEFYVKDTSAQTWTWTWRQAGNDRKNSVGNDPHTKHEEEEEDISPNESENHYEEEGGGQEDLGPLVGLTQGRREHLPQLLVYLRQQTQNGHILMINSTHCT